MPRLLAPLLLSLSLALPASAAAAGCDAPQGTAAVDQYCEVVPGAKGDTSSRSGGGGSSDGGGSGSISDRRAAALVAQGKDGEALARALGKDPAKIERSPGKAGHAKPLPSGTKGSLPKVPSSNPFTAVTQAVSGTATIGSSFFLALFAVVLLMLGSAWIGWRRNSSS